MNHLPYPKSIIEFQRTFQSERDCEEYLFKSRWPNGFVCPVCGDREFYFIETRRIFKCKSKGHQTSLTAGTVMHRTKQPLLLWFWAAYIMTTETPGVSALQLQRQLGLKRYEVAYNLLQKLRASMVRHDRDKISGTVEVDETYIGGPTTGGKRGRGAKKAIVVAAVERKDKFMGRIRLRKIPNVTEETLLGFIKETIEPGSYVETDGFSSYRNLSKHGYDHRPIAPDDVDVALPKAHIVFGNLKTWLKGTFHGVSPKHLQAYLNEFVFRFNRRKTPMAAFQTLLGLSTNVEQWPEYKTLYSGKWIHPNAPIVKTTQKVL
ncbi:MAG: IS1595 family transposase [Nitrospirota bacterium]|nr:IS1595 family transposase [Nitrospirota bacterium]